MNPDQVDELKRMAEELYRLHEEMSISPERCREFNRRCALFLDRVEDLGMGQMALRVMDLLASCSPKDQSSCENATRTKGILERIRERLAAER